MLSMPFENVSGPSYEVNFLKFSEHLSYVKTRVSCSVEWGVKSDNLEKAFFFKPTDNNEHVTRKGQFFKQSSEGGLRLLHVLSD